MKTIKETIRFQLSLYLKSNKIMVPFIVLVAAVYFIYNQKPQEVVSSFNTTAVICFYIMFWIGLVYNDVTDQTLEQIMILRLKSARKYYLCNEIVLTIIACIISIVAVGYAVFAHVTNGFTLFTGGLHVDQVICSILLHMAASITGGLCGAIFHIRIFKERKTLIFCAFVVAIMAIAKELVAKEIGIFKYISWLFPPVSEFARIYKNVNHYTSLNIAKGIFIMCIYGIIVTIIKEQLLLRNKF